MCELPVRIGPSLKGGYVSGINSALVMRRHDALLGRIASSDGAFSSVRDALCDKGMGKFFFSNGDSNIGVTQ